MHHPILILTLLAATTIASAAETTIVYDFTSEASHPNAPPRRGHAVFAINPVTPGYLRRALELRGPLQELRELVGADEIAHH